MVVTVAAALISIASTVASAKPGVAESDRLFTTAKAVCEHDAKKLWGLSLCGPILLVDYHDQAMLANLSDTQHFLTPDGTANATSVWPRVSF